MVDRIKLFCGWFWYWRGIDDGFSFVDDLRTSWNAAKCGHPVPVDSHGGGL